MRGERVTDRLDRPGVTPFREVRHRLERQHARTLRSGEGVLRPARARVRRLVARRGLVRRPRAARLGGGAAPAEGVARGAPGRTDARRRLRHRLPHQPPPWRRRRARPERADARRRTPSRRRSARFVHGDALSLPFEDGAFDRVFTSYFYCHLEDDERVRFLAEARRVAPELVVVAPITRRRRRDRALGGASAEGRLALAGLQARVRAGSSSPPSSAGEVLFSGPLVRRRARLDASTLVATARSPRCSATTRVCRACVEAGLSPRVAARRERASSGSAPTCTARRPGSSKARSGDRGAAGRARPCAAGSSSRRTSSTRRSTARP